MSREEIEVIVNKIIENIGATSSNDFSKVMPIAIRDLKGKIDSKVVHEIVKQQLGE